ncbi:hypothetical protein AJ80_00034 [Polytolypa hystricis UAMH7299]|uniref:Uncharacterized protein n=1 Tax=Polytolypa hystricis (strain UAMH7299) TaxID=1447883 RepID=A0A2B7YVM8_POLH7|nr:hypothetical protein AJ80_00034 [Polytolypa hystricis UAMH7299]
MLYRSLISLGLLGFAVAETTVPVLMLGFEPQAMVASIVNADADKTTYVIECALTPGEPYTVTEGPKTLAATSKEGDSLYGIVNCSVDPSKSAHCTKSMSGTLTNSDIPRITSGVIKITDVNYYPVKITAGVEKLQASATTTNSEDAGSASSTGGMPKMTSSAGLIVGGAAVAAAFLI